MMEGRFEYYRCVHGSAEYKKLLSRGWELLCISTIGMALMIREKGR
jgi:hypothetical protein